MGLFVVIGPDTTCSYRTESNTLVGVQCKQFTGIITPACDAWGEEYVPDEQLDETVDDCGSSNDGI